MDVKIKIVDGLLLLCSHFMHTRIRTHLKAHFIPSVFINTYLQASACRQANIKKPSAVSLSKKHTYIQAHAAIRLPHSRLGLLRSSHSVSCHVNQGFFEPQYICQAKRQAAFNHPQGKPWARAIDPSTNPQTQSQTVIDRLTSSKDNNSRRRATEAT